MFSYLSKEGKPALRLPPAEREACCAKKILASPILFPSFR
jgi:hypothetical protein